MTRITFPVGSFEVNCTILVRPEGAWIIDPGSEATLIAAKLKQLGLAPTAILLTHGHFDHIGGIPALQQRFPNLPVYVHPLDVMMLGHPMNVCPPDYPFLEKPANIRDCRILDGVEVIETPGHTPGGVCYLFREEKLLFTGDTLFAGSAGRTDFPGGSMSALRDSLAKIAALPEDLTVIPGHGPETTVAREKASNPFMT